MQAKLELSTDSFRVNGLDCAFPIPIETLKASLGACRCSKKPQNTIYTWDNYGMVAYSNDGKLVQSLCLNYKQESFDFSPKELFGGSFLFRGQEIMQYFASHPEQLTQIYDTDTTGGFVCNGVSVWFDLGFDDDGDIEAIELSPFKEQEKEAIPSDKYLLGSSEEELLQFQDFGFKLCIVQELMYNLQLIEPKFDLFEFVLWYKERNISLETEGYKPIPEVTNYFKNLPLPKRLAQHITEIYQDGGNDIYLNLLRFAEGDEEYWDIESAADAQQFPNLKKATLCYAKKSVLQELEDLGISASWL